VAHEPVIVIAPMGGLCNRMQALDSAIALAREVGSGLQVIWYRSPNINCSFEDLFTTPDAISRTTEINLYNWTGRFRRRLYRKYFQHFFDHYLRHRDIPADEAALEGLARDKRLFVTAYRRFYEQRPLFADFGPAASLQATIDAHAMSFRNTVGVHVRRTDNRHARQYSPTGLFVERMRREVANDDTTEFFVATDSPDVERLLNDEFPGRITSHRKRSLDRNDGVAIQDAVIDLYCLSRCRKLIGSYWSSFSETAWQLGNIEKTIVYRE
jgi:hypothetical protein